jgi:DNA-binding NarL/FixJ family response regulator
MKGLVANDNHRSAPAVRVLVVEDFDQFRRLICSMLGRMPGLQIVGEASDGLEAVREAEKLQPDVILLDIGLPTLNGMEAARQIRALSPQSKIIFVTQESDPGIVEGALNLGAKGYVVKIQAATDLPAALDAALDGRRFVSGALLCQEITMQAQTASSD